MIAIPLILFFGPLAFKIWYDARQWYKHRNEINLNSITNHPKEMAICFPFLVASGYFFSTYIEVNIYAKIAIIFFMQFFVWWTLFDGGYNLLRHFNFFFTGSREKDDATTDKVLSHWAKWAVVAVKIAGCATFIYLFIKFLK